MSLLFSPAPVPTSLEPTPAQRLDTVRDLMLAGAAGLARDLCASLFLDGQMLTASDADCRQRYLGCLLRLGMPVLLVRFLRAVTGVDLSISRLPERRQLFSFGNGHVLAVPMLMASVRDAASFEEADRWAAAILETAAQADTPAPLPALSVHRLEETLNAAVC